MKFEVKIQFNIDTNEYCGIESTLDGAMNLVKDMLLHEADLPENIIIHIIGPDGIGMGDTLSN